ncbi:MAG: hypothetical protein GY708_14795, partial [Actinomycetia bacterium]|nr:hypothetical protein [Actinomycetes bacterium]
MSDEIEVHVDGAEHARIHTSCSEAIGPGLFAGDFLVVEGRSRDGGPLYPLPLACEVVGAGRLTVEGRRVTWQLENVGSATVTHDTIS